MRRDPIEVEDAICDGGGDKGIDALLYDEDGNELFVLQSKHRQNATATQGDADLRSFVGVAAYFQSPESVQSLLDSGPNEELRALLTERLHVAELLERQDPTITLIFATNAYLDVAGERGFENASRVGVGRGSRI